MKYLGFIIFILFSFSQASFLDHINQIPIKPIDKTKRQEKDPLLQGVRTNRWVIKLNEGEDPYQVAEQLGLQYLRSTTIPRVYVYQNIENFSEEEIQLRSRSIKIEWIEPETLRKIQKRSPQNDPLFGDQWHLQNTGQGGGQVGADANVVPAWNLGYTGNGVQICIVDDGVEYTHGDLSPRYQPADSYDFNDNDPNPLPQATDDNHGTACAGVALAADDGVKCGVGAAYRSNLAAVRAIGGTGNGLTDLEMVGAITYRNQDNDIYSNSWGYDSCDSNACTLIPLQSFQEEGLEESAENGRDGKGNIWVFAGGNTRQVNSDVNYQDYPRSRYTITVASYTNRGVVAFYSDPGAALMVAAPSNGGTRSITTTDRTGTLGYSPGDCTNSFGGTSSSTPLVAGVISLMLEANQNLTWRDVMDIIAYSSTPINPTSNEWQTNGAGFHVSHNFGFGGINAGAAVAAALERTSHLTCENFQESSFKIENLPIPDNNPTGITSEIIINGFTGTIEQTYITVNIQHTFRGDLRIILESPSGTFSVLARLREDPDADYVNWRFKSNFNWGENPNGIWKLHISDLFQDDTGSLTSWKVSFFGKCEGDIVISPPPFPTFSPTSMANSIKTCLIGIFLSLILLIISIPE